MMTQIDVLLPTYNSGRYLRATIDSILQQTFKSIRVLVIDDGSTDDTAEIVRGLRELDSRIIYVYQKNGGVVSALDAGLALCEADLVARHDADDLSDPGRLEMQFAYMEANADCVALSCLARHIDGDGNTLGTISTFTNLTKADETSVPASEPYLLQPMLMVRSAALRHVGAYRCFLTSEDSDLYWRLQEHGRLHILPEVLGSYRLHSNSLSSASIVNGRQMSVWSQLAALSAQRRRSGNYDIVFDEAFMSAVQRETTFDDIYRAAAKSLSGTEQTWLASAASAKLLALSYYRPFEPEVSDIKFIRKAMKADRQLKQRRGYGMFRESVISASIRLMISGRVVEAFSLTETALWPKLLARILFRTIVPVPLKRWLKDRRCTSRGGLA